MEENLQESRPLAMTPTWSIATVMAMFVTISMVVERSIQSLSKWLTKNNKISLVAALEKMKEEMMLLGFISLLLTATSSIISSICIPSQWYNSTSSSSSSSSCSRSHIDKDREKNSSKERQLLTPYTYPHILRRMLDDLHMHSCKEGHEPIISFEGLEQLHRFIFVMAVTHISYSCLTILLAIVKIRSWRAWEDEAHNDRPNSLNETTKELTVHRQTTLVRFCKSNLLARNTLLVWVTCFFRQFGRSVVRIDYLALRKRFIMSLLWLKRLVTIYHGTYCMVVGCMQYACTTIFYMIRYMEEEFQKIVGVSGPLWGFVVAFMLFNIDGSNLYFWIAIIPISLVLLVGTKLQRIIATLALENAGNTGLFSRARLASRDELFWFNKPELLLPLIHFILFQNSFELASFFWTWWQFGYKSCIMRNHLLVYLRLIFGFAGQFLCSYSTLPLHALVTQMGTNYKAALIPECIRETMHGSEEEARSRRKRRRHDMFTDDSTIHSDTSTFVSIEEDYDGHTSGHDVELQPTRAVTPANNRSSRVVTPHHKYSASVSSSVVLESVSSSVVEPSLTIETIPRSSSLPKGRYDQ